MNANRNNFIQEFAKIIEINVDEIKLDKPLMGYANYDSLAIISMIAMVENHFSVGLKGSEIEKIETLQALFSKVDKELSP